MPVVEVLCRRMSGSSGERVFATRTGGWVDPGNVRRQWRDAVKGTNLAWTTPHTLRRTAATVLQRALGLEAASAQLGHASVLITQQAYVEREDRVGDFRGALTF